MHYVSCSVAQLQSLYEIQGMYCIMLVAQLHILYELQGMYCAQCTYCIMLVAQLQSLSVMPHQHMHCSCLVAEFIRGDAWLHI
jgi:hypothetical protein